MKKAVIFLMLLTLTSKLLGFLRDITLSYFFGASNVSDAYLIALTIPDSIFSFIITGIATGFIPLYSRINKEGNDQVANKFVSNLIGFILLLCTFIAFISLMFTEPIVKLFASGFDRESMDLAVFFMRISIFGIYFTGLITIFNGYLQVNNSFIISALSGIPLNLIIIFSIALSANNNVTILAIGSVIAVFIQLIFLLPSVFKKGFKYHFILDRHDEDLKQMLFLSLPIIIGVSVNQINVLIDKTIASHVALGGISALTYAERLNLFIQGSFVMSIITVMYPSISKLAAQNDLERLKKTVSNVISSINILVIPITIGTLALSKPIVLFLFGRGAFDAAAVSMTSDALFFYSIGMLGFGLREVLSRVFYAFQDTRIPMNNAIFATVINILLSVLLSKYLGIGGLALATSIAGILSSILLFIKLKSRIGSFGIKNIFITFLKISLSSIFMGIVVKTTYEILIDQFNSTLTLLLCIMLGIFVYLFIIIFTKVEEVDIIIIELKKRWKGFFQR
ncbi:murein biosynthesis integral membrane protein MurJ [Peribacillus sp. NPDC097198]|uniref:murein biosynthesis integral membrane protein MurJ n=1 Tax=Peribacillus sp. NPDC097198 TaxID=3364397 RepID=UPI0038025F19